MPKNGGIVCYNLIDGCVTCYRYNNVYYIYIVYSVN